MCTTGLSPIFTTDPSPSPSIVEHRINSIQNAVYLRVPVLALYCSSYTQANCLRSSNVTYQMCTPTPTKRNCIYPSMPILELSSRPLYRLCKTADIRKWMLQDRLRLNDDKTEFIIIGKRQQLAKVNIDSMQVGESSITPASRVKNLGCWFDGQLKMDTQINSICKTALFHLYNIRRIRKFLNFECTKILVNAFVTSRLDFCNSLLYGLSNNQIN